MNYLIELLALIGGFYLIGQTYRAIKTLWLTRRTLFESILNKVENITGNKGLTNSLQEFCDPVLPPKDNRRSKKITYSKRKGD